MPKKKKNIGVSPSRKSINSETIAATGLASSPVDRAMSQAPHGVNKEELFSSLSEMFSDLDPTVVYMVLSECDFRVEDTMDYLLELSMAAKRVTSPSVSGFDTISASLFVENQPKPIANETEDYSSKIKNVMLNEDSENFPSSKELVYLLNNSLEKYINNERKDLKNDQVSGNLSPVLDKSSYSCVKKLPEFARSSLSYNDVLSSQQMEAHSEKMESILPALNPDYCKMSEPVLGKSSTLANNSLDDTAIFAQIPENCSLPEVVLDSSVVPETITQTSMEVSCAKLGEIKNTVLDHTLINSLSTQLCQGLAESEASALDTSSSCDTEKQENTAAVCYDPKDISVPDLCPISSFKFVPFVNVNQSQQTWNPHISVLQKHCQEFTWNLTAPAFYPQSHSFITPVAISPGHWRPASNYRTFEKVGSPQESSQCWDINSSLVNTLGNKDGSQNTLSPVHQLPVCHVRRKTPFAGHVLVLLRGVPGSGKSYLARSLLEDNPGGVILSTDDYFYKKTGQYQFDADHLSEAHEWNWKRAKEEFEKRVTPIIIDNTNIQAWEMKPYVTLSQQHKYKVIFREPDTWWKFKPKELERRNIHGVSKEKIKKMLERYERCLTVNSILNSSMPSELKSATCEDDSRKKGPGKENTVSCGEKEPFALPLKCTELSMGEKHLLGGEALENQNLQNEKKESRYKLLECHSEYSSSLDHLDIYASPPRTEKIEPLTEMGIIKTDLEKTEESTHSQCSAGNIHDCSAENIQECNNQDLDVQVEANQCSEVLLGKELTKRRTTNKDSSSFEKSERPEILNFVGDWPVEQTMGQRLKRPRRLEKFTIKDDEEDNRINMPLFDSLKKKLGGDEKLPFSENRQEDNNRISVCISDADSTEDASGTLMVGGWPVQSLLAQRQHKVRRIPNRGPSKSEEVTTGCYDTDNSVLNPLAIFPGTSESSEELLVSSKRESIQVPESSASETVNEKKPSQSKRTRKHHKLALTFTNNLAHSKPEEQLSLFHLLEEKPGEHSSAASSQYSQTEPKDFALLWRLERKIIASENTKVLHGKLDGFIPKSVDAPPDYTQKILDKVTYDKSTYVEESELVYIDESENLNILCKLFGSFSFDALKDLYERCNRDIDWTTGILLDSAEKLCKDDDTKCLQEAIAQLPGMALDSKGNVYCEETLMESDKLTQLSRTTRIIQNSENVDFSVNDGGKTLDDPKLHAEIPNLLTNDVSVSSIENKKINHNAPSRYVGELNTEKSVLDTLKTQPKELTPVVVSENNQQNTALSTEIDFCVLGTVHDYLNEDPTTLRNTSETETGSRSSEECQECTEIKDRTALALLMNPVSLKDSVNNEGRSESYKEMKYEPMFSTAAENEESKMPSQNGYGIKLLNPTSVPQSVNIDCLELVLPPELAIQLNEIFGPVGVDSETLTEEDYVVHIDLSLAKEIHEKWKTSIVKRQKREEELHKLLVKDPAQFEQFCLHDVDNVLSQHMNHQEVSSHPSTESSVASEVFPFMDHWNVQTQKVSLREIMSEEIALQEKQDLKRFPFMATKDCAAILKEKQLLEMFPTISPNFLVDIFKDYNYSLEQTVQFLNCVLEADPVKTVVAKETAQGATLSSYSVSKSRDKKAKKCKESDDIPFDKKFQDFTYPGYDDFRAEAFLHQKKWHECLRKAGEAYRMGMKPVAAFYVQQGRLHEQKMKEANHDAAVQIFEKVNASLLPENLMDLHGLHVDEALDYLSRVLLDKAEEYSQAGGKPYLYVITGKGNHSQGGVARIKPAVIKYLGSHKFRFTEIKPGCLKVMLK